MTYFEKKISNTKMDLVLAGLPRPVNACALCRVLCAMLQCARKNNQ
jgi:hypothetical protein